jgi:tripartite-type tricarboxylate transporter receptor subunit TctC
MKKCFIFIIYSFLSGYFLFLWVSTLWAQTYPNRPIQIIIPLDSGSAVDTMARNFADELCKVLKVPIIAINKPGAASTLGTDIVVKSKKDGYTILYANTSAVVYSKASNPEQVPYDPIKDLEPLGLHCFFPGCLVVNESLGLKTFSTFINFAKKNPGKLRISTFGVGSIDHFNLEIIQSLTNAQFTMIPFKGAAAALTALLGGHVDATYTTISLARPHVEAGKIKILLIAKKMHEYPDVPTITELGYKQNLLIPWFALFAPAGIPEEVKQVLIPAIETTVKNPELGAKIEKLGFIVDYKSPSESRELMMSEYKIARELAIKLGLGK